MTVRGSDHSARPVGVLGGTFDPVHVGHLHVATAVLRAFPLDRVLLMPCASPPHKARGRLTPARHRLAMLRLACSGREGVGVSTVELDRGGVSYTVVTLRELARSGTPPVFILGTDSLLEIRTWSRWRDLVREFDLIAVDRPGRDLERTPEALPEEIAARLVRVPDRRGAIDELPGPSPGGGGRVYHLPIPPVDASSSGIRARAAAGSSLSGLVPPEVARYIQEHRLYRQEGCC